MVDKRKFFGTDGIRGRVGIYPITPDFVLKLAWAAGQVFKKSQGRTKVVIGKDTRVSGYMFESSLEAGFIAAGVDVYLTGPMPTPAIAYLTKTLHADAGVVISASHNGHEDNGIKFFNAQGEKLSDALEAEIETWLEKPLNSVASEHIGRAKRINDAAGRYIEFCKSTFKPAQSLAGLRIVLDLANGATYHIAPSVFEELGADVRLIAHKPDGLNINRGCGATDLDALQQAVRNEDADLGIAFDGDGDRVMMVDDQGDVVDGDIILYALAIGQHPKPEGVVGTLMSNLGLEKALEKEEIAFVRADVGDRFVMQELRNRGWTLGSEPSGHVLCLGQTSTGDAIVSALQMLKVLLQNNIKLSDMRHAYRRYPQVLINVTVKDKATAMQNPHFIEALASVEARMGTQGRVLIRPSGTEPKIRVMIEGENAVQIKAYAQEIAQTLHE